MSSLDAAVSSFGDEKKAPRDQASNGDRSALDSSASAVTYRLRGLLSSLTSSQLAIAELVLADPLAVSGWSISQLADAAGVSDTSVTRFCRRLGLDGYPALRRTLFAADQQRSAMRRFTVGRSGAIVDGDSQADIARKVAFAESRAISETLEQLDEHTLSKVVHALANSRRTDIYGVASSSIVAADLQYKLDHLGLFSSHTSDIHRALVCASHSGPGDLAIGISQSGRTRETIEPVQEARRRGALSVALTNNAASPLAQASELVLICSGEESAYRTGATVSRTAQLYLIDCLYASIAQLLQSKSETALAQAHNAVKKRKNFHHSTA